MSLDEGECAFRSGGRLCREFIRSWDDRCGRLWSGRPGDFAPLMSWSGTGGTDDRPRQPEVVVRGQIALFRSPFAVADIYLSFPEPEGSKVGYACQEGGCVVSAEAAHRAPNVLIVDSSGDRRRHSLASVRDAEGQPFVAGVPSLL